MRNPNRIYEFMKYLTEVWVSYFPDWRFGQFIENIRNYYGGDLFYLEEEDFKNLVSEYLKSMGCT